MADFFNLMLDFWKQILAMIAIGLCMNLAKKWGDEYGEVAYWGTGLLIVVSAAIYLRLKSKKTKEER